MAGSLRNASGAPSDGALWFALLGGAAAWSVHLLVSYPLVGVACLLGGVGILYLVTVISAAGAVAATVVGWRAWRHTPGAVQSGAAGARLQRVRAMGLWGALLSGFFLLVTLVEALPILFQGPCAYGP